MYLFSKFCVKTGLPQVCGLMWWWQKVPYLSVLLAWIPGKRKWGHRDGNLQCMAAVTRECQEWEMSLWSGCCVGHWDWHEIFNSSVPLCDLFEIPHWTFEKHQKQNLKENRVNSQNQGRSCYSSCISLAIDCERSKDHRVFLLFPLLCYCNLSHFVEFVKEKNSGCK